MVGRVQRVILGSSAPVLRSGAVLTAAAVVREMSYLKSFPNALRACVYIYIRQLSSFRAPTLCFIEPIVPTCHI